jgi:hypothetical protein
MSRLREIARQAAHFAQLEFWKYEGPLDIADFMADAVTTAVLQAIRERVGNQADRCRNEAFDALWRVCDELDHDLLALSAPLQPSQSTETKEFMRAATTRESIEPLPHASETEGRTNDDGPNIDDECPSCGGSGEVDCFEDVCACVGGHPCPRCV